MVISEKIKDRIGWFVLLAPASIILFVMLFSGSSLLTDQSKIGASYEAGKHNSYGETLFNQGKYREAGQQFMTAIKIKPDMAEAYLNLGKVYYQVGDMKNAVEQLRKSLAFKDANKELIYNNLGLIYAGQQKYNQAAEMFQSALKMKIKTAIVYRNLASVYSHMGMKQEAIKAYEKAISHHPTIRSLYMDMLREAARGFKAEGREELYLKTEELVDRGVTDEFLNRFDLETIQTYALEKQNIAEDWRHVAELYMEMGALDSATAAMEQAVIHNPSKASHYNKLGVLYARLKKFDAASKAFKKAVELDPSRGSYRKNLDHCSNQGKTAETSANQGR